MVLRKTGPYEVNKDDGKRLVKGGMLRLLLMSLAQAQPGCSDPVQAVHHQVLRVNASISLKMMLIPHVHVFKCITMACGGFIEAYVMQ